MTTTLERQAAGQSNDYSHLEARYRTVTGAELVLDPHGSALHPLPDLALSASVVIPAWNVVAVQQRHHSRAQTQHRHRHCGGQHHHLLRR
jgi:hypothetical protein